LLLDDDNDEELAFSPPRIPKNSPSYLIWSIFTKERENRNKAEKKKAAEKQQVMP